jgi:hypothetical protein
MSAMYGEIPASELNPPLRPEALRLAGEQEISALLQQGLRQSIR